MKWTYRKFIEWFFYRPSFEGVLLKLGTMVLIASFAVRVIKVVLSNNDGSIALSFSPDGDGSVWGMIVGTTLIGAGLVVGVINHIGDWRTRIRHRVIAIELRGLEAIGDTPLLSAIPKTIKGRREEVLIDVRKHVHDGRVTDPAKALARVTLLPHDFNERRRGMDRSDTSVYLGGMMAVPLMFTAGMLMDDEHKIDGRLDWDRDLEGWRHLDGDDDGDRFAVTGLATVQNNCKEVVLTVSASYGVDEKEVKSFKNGIPLVSLELPNRSFECHWSEDKQQALAGQFRDVLRTLTDKKVGTIHLFIAGANSLIFRLGQSYDKRNMPPGIIYQFERSSKPPYPWGVLLPTHGAQPAIT